MAEPTNDVAAETAELPATKEKLNELTQAASLQYSLKNFSSAADHYADAAEIQGKLNGEMAPENAELLFNYGRALYKVAIAKSDVLGTKVAQEEKKKPKAKKAKKSEPIPEEEEGPAKEKQTAGSKPFFQLTGMENWDDSDEEEDDEENEDGEEEEQDDFADAFQMFDLARVLYHKQVEALEAIDDAGKGKGKKELTPEVRSIKEKLADIYGFLTDLSFENERFHDAIPDAETSLALLEELYQSSHEKIVSAHYTLSLALEFASVSKIREEQANQSAAAGAPQPTGDSEIDWDLRNEAIKHTQLAIEKQEAHLKKAEEALSSETFTPEKRKELDAELTDKKGMLDDLKTRVSPSIPPYIKSNPSLTRTSSPTSKKTPQSKKSTPSTKPSSTACSPASCRRPSSSKRPRWPRRQSLQTTSRASSSRRRSRSRQRQRQRPASSRVAARGSWRSRMGEQRGRGQRRRRGGSE